MEYQSQQYQLNLLETLQYLLRAFFQFGLMPVEVHTFFLSFTFLNLKDQELQLWSVK